MWSLYVGRPVAIDDKHITAQPPASTDTNQPKRYWQPYIDETNAYNPIRLHDPIEDVSKYTPSRYPDTQLTFRDPTTLLPFAIQLQKQLQNWYTNLPEHIKVDHSNRSTYHLPHTLQLQ